MLHNINAQDSMSIKQYNLANEGFQIKSVLLKKGYYTNTQGVDTVSFNGKENNALEKVVKETSFVEKVKLQYKNLLNKIEVTKPAKKVETEAEYGFYEHWLNNLCRKHKGDYIEFNVVAEVSEKLRTGECNFDEAIDMVERNGTRTPTYLAEPVAFKQAMVLLKQTDVHK